MASFSHCTSTPDLAALVGNPFLMRTFFCFPPLHACADRVILSANSHTSTPFYIVINPASGPGSPNSQPDANYQACIPKLKATANKNVKVIGYVSTSYGNRAEADVNGDVATYKGWGTAYRPNGVFYDEAPTASGLVSLYSRYASNARTQLGGTVSIYSRLPTLSVFSGLHTLDAFRSFSTPELSPIQPTSTPQTSS